MAASPTVGVFGVAEAAGVTVAGAGAILTDCVPGESDGLAGLLEHKPIRRKEARLERSSGFVAFPFFFVKRKHGWGDV